MEMKFNIEFGDIEGKIDTKGGVEVLDDMLKTILDRIFDGDVIKSKVTKFSNRLTFSCPYCGDTHQKRFKYRGNIFFDNWKYKCFNCGILKTVGNFLQDFKDVANLSQSDIWKISSCQAIDYNPSRNTSFFDVDTFSAFFKLEYSEWVKDMDLDDIEVGSEIYSYLRGRKIPKMFIRDIKYNAIKDALVIPNLVKFGDKDYIISYSDRPFVDRGSKYIIHNFKSLIEFDESWDDNEYENFNYIANMYRFFNLNFSKRIIICEGYFDSLFLPNACSLSGANKMIPFDGEFHFLFDNDKTGLVNSIKYLKDNRGFVFKWKSFLEDYDLKSDIKDINDSVIELYKNGIDYRTVDFYKYFTNDKLDLLWL